MTIARVAAWPVPAVGQGQLRGLIFGAGTQYAVQSIEGFDLPPISNSDSARAGSDGSFGGLDTTPKRSLILHIAAYPDLVVSTPKAVLLRNLNAAFAASQNDLGLVWNHPDLGPMLFVGRPRRCSYVIDRQLPTRWQEGVLAQFDALDPVYYNATLGDAAIAYPSAGVNAGVAFDRSSLPGLTFAPNPHPVQNSGFEEAALTPWATTAAGVWAAGATLTRDAAQTHGGAAAGKVVTTAAANEGVWQASAIPAYFVPGQSYTFSCWVFTNSAGAVLQAAVNDATNAVNTLSPAVATPQGAWTLLSVTCVIGALTPATLRFGVRDNGAAAVRTFWVDDAQMDVGAVAQPYAAIPTLMGVPFGAVGGGSGRPGVVSVTNNGTANSAPVSTFSGPSIGPLAIEHVETGEAIVLNINLGAADVLEVDHDMRTVILNGSSLRQDVIDTSTVWWVLPPGVSTIRYRAFGPSAGSSVDFKFRDASW